MTPFTYTAQASRVVFGAGALAQLGPEIERLGARGALPRRGGGDAARSSIRELLQHAFDGTRPG